MPRKVKFSCKKNWERKRQTKVSQVSQPQLPATQVTTSQPQPLASSQSSIPVASQGPVPAISQPPTQVTFQPPTRLTSQPPTAATSNPPTLDDIRKSLVLPESWVEQSHPPLSCVRVCKLYSKASSSNQPLVITHCLTIHSDLTWSLFVHNREVKQSLCPSLASIPNRLTPHSLKSFLPLIDRLRVCAGQPDSKFVKMGDDKKGVFKSLGEQLVAFVDEYAPVIFQRETFNRTVRTKQCELLVHDEKCNSCKKYRATLRALASRHSHRCSDEVSDSKSHTNIRYLNTPEKKRRIVNTKKRAQLAEKEIAKLQAKIQELSEKCGEHVDSRMHNDLLAVMNENSCRINQIHPEGSFANLFWKEQLKAASAKDPRQVRWHPLIIRWCLNLKLMSSSAYHATRTAGFIKFPSERTLRDYTHYFKHRSGYQLEVNEQLQKEAKLKDLPENRRYCSLVLDEMKIKENLVYDKFNGEIVGFTSLGDINDQLQKLERDCQSGAHQPEIAKHVLVIMIRGILFKLDFPLAHFATGALTAEQIFPIVWEGIRLVESFDLKVMCITADGASPNRKFFKMHTGSPADSVTYRTRNRYAPKNDRWIYFVSDPPHLMKTTRNCLQHSSSSGTRHMMRNSQFIEWSHIEELYEKTHGMAVASKGLNLLPKLKYEHIHLSSQSKMRVDLAAQVLSTSVANALSYFGDPKTKETEHFVREFDRFFDCLNVRSLYEWEHKKKEDLKPYTSPEDERLKWLEGSFLKYIDEWESSAKRQSQLSAAERRKLCLSEETLEGLRMTVKSFVAMTKELLSQPGSEDLFLLSERFSQDPLENYFGKQRTRGSRNDNPSFKECLQNAVAIRAQKSLELDRVQGNCRRKRQLGEGAHTLKEGDDTPLPKRKRHNK